VNKTAIECSDIICSSEWNLGFWGVWRYTYLIQVGSALPGGGTESFIILPEGPASLGYKYCLSGPNSVHALGSRMSGSGVPNVTGFLHLYADHAPDQPAVADFESNMIQQPFGNGYRCVGGSTVRLGAAAGTGGVFDRVVDLQSAGITAGIYYFQFWYRDPSGEGSGYSLSDGYRITLGL
jgi:hypothetical protein